ncbi:MAG: SdrD B-like domain-containing protein, partial [Planctomycetota bacterium]
MKKVVNVNAAISNIVCDGKGTSTTTDDTYTFVLTVTGSGGGTTWQGGFSNACLGAFAIGPTAYGTPITLGPFPAGAGSCGNTSPPIQFQNGLNIDVSVADTENPTCSKNTTVVSPGPCSPTAVAGLGDFVWNDLNQNGAQNAGEPGVPNVTVNLYKCDGTFMGTTVTNATGFYSFTNLASNMQYFVEFTNLPGGFQFSPKDAAADNIDSDANTGNGRTDCTFLSPGEFDNTIDAGIFQSVQQVGSIGDCVWNDVNQNGLKDIGEPGVPGVTVKLLNCAGAVLQTTTTNANGNYSFNNLPAGSYIVEFSGLPSGFQFTTKDAGNDSADSDANPANGRTDCFNLALGQNDPTRDAGIFQPTPQPASVGDFVWNDLDKDGVQDAGEPGVQGVLVKLYRCDNSFIGQFTTNANGGYQFINLSPGSYFVQFSNLPAGFQFSPMDAGGDDSKDSDANTTTGNTACFNLVAGQNDPTRDAGVFQSTGTGPGTVGDFVWFDTNANGIQDAGEPGVSGIFVILETCAGQFVNFAVTNALGGYLITNVPAGSYRVKFASPGSINGSPVQFTVKDAGGDDTKDSDADNLGFSACFNLAAGQSNLTLDAGFVGQTPPQVCTINGSVSNVVCNANGTVSFTIVVNGTNTGDWGFDIPALNQFTLQYGQPYNFSIPGSANPTVLQILDHDVADCKTTVSITSPAPCNTGGGTPTGCDAVTFTGGAGSISVSGLSAPIEIVKVFNAAWQTVFECSANCNNPTVANNLPAGTYFVKVQLFTSTWGLICTKEGYVTVSNFSGGGGNERVVNPGNGSEPQQAASQAPGASVSERTGGDASGETAKTASLDLFPNPAQGYAIVNWGEAADWQQAELTLFNSLGQAVQKVTLDHA